MKPAAAFLVLFSILLLCRVGALPTPTAQRNGGSQITKATDAKTATAFTHILSTESKSAASRFDLLADIDDEDDLAKKLLPLVKCLLLFSLVFLLYILGRRFTYSLPFPTHLSLSGTDRLLRLSTFRI